jgi:hypothetical protein
MNDELEKMWEEAVVDCFKILLGHFPAGTEGNPDYPQSLSRAR